MPSIGAPELLLLLLVLILLFGAKRLPDTARSLGRSMRIFKAETKGMREDDAARSGEARSADDEHLPRRHDTPAVSSPPPTERDR